MSTPHKIPHLVKRGSTYWFRMAVPRKHAGRLRLQEIKGSLRTSEVVVARRRSRMLSSMFEGVFAREKYLAALTHETIKALAQQYFQDCLNRSAEQVSMMQEDPTVDLAAEIETAIAQLAVLQNHAATDTSSPLIKSEAIGLLKSNGLNEVDSGLDAIRLLQSALIRAKLENVRITAAKLRGDFAATAPLDPWFKDMDVSDFPPLPGEQTRSRKAITLGEATIRYLAAKDQSTVKKTIEAYRLSLKICCDVWGESIPLSHITHEHVRELRDAITSLPAHFRKQKALRNLSVPELVKLEGFPKLAQKTQWKYFANFKSFSKWCVDEGYLNSAPGPKIRIKPPTRMQEEEARLPFSGDQLARFFASPLYTGSASNLRRASPGSYLVRDGYWWVPLIGLYSGLRLGEIIQLRASDVKESAGILYFDIARAGDDGKQIKSASSLRRVPIHRILLELGFAERVNLQKATNSGNRVFEDIKPGADGYNSHNFSKWFGRYLKRADIKTKKTTFHSLRHNFKDALVSGEVSTHVAMALMGHAEHDVHSTYGSKLKLAVLNDGIQRVEYPSIDISQIP